MTTPEHPQTTPQTSRKAPKPGRPAGSKTQKPIYVDARPTACVRCGSTARTPKKHIITRYHAEGGWYFRTIIDQVFCLDCGQRYRPRTRHRQKTPFGHH